MSASQAIRQPSKGQRNPISIASDIRNMGIHIVAGKGSGKSRLMGRVIGYQDFAAGIPLVFIDPHGTTIDNFLDKLTYLPVEVQQQIVDRLVYIDVSGKLDYVPSLPLYYRLPGDSLRQAAQRFLNVVKRLDPNLTNAPILGWNAIERVGTNVGMVLVGLDLQVTEAPSLLNETEKWVPRLHQLEEQQPEAKPAVDYFLFDYLKQEGRERRRESESFLSKVLPFTHDVRMQAMFASPLSAIDWQQVVKKRQVVMLDFRNEDDADQTRFKILWLLTGLMEYIKRRGPTRKSPVSIIVDELTYLLALNSSGYDLLSADLEDLINRIARNNNIWLTLAHQEMYQTPLAVQKTLMTMGTQILGVTTDEEAALTFARRYFSYEPNAAKAYRPVYHDARIIDYTPVEFSVEEQDKLNSYNFTRMKTYQFWIAPCQKEGSPQTELLRADISRFDPDQFVNERLVSEFRTRLVRKDSTRVDKACDLIRKRQEEALPAKSQVSSTANAEEPVSQFTAVPQRSRRKKKGT